MAGRERELTISTFGSNEDYEEPMLGAGHGPRLRHTTDQQQEKVDPAPGMAIFLNGPKIVSE